MNFKRLPAPRRKLSFEQFGTIPTALLFGVVAVAFAKIFQVFVWQGERLTMVKFFQMGSMLPEGTVVTYIFSAAFFCCYFAMKKKALFAVLSLPAHYVLLYVVSWANYYLGG